MESTRQRSVHDVPTSDEAAHLLALVERLPHFVGVADDSGTVRWLNRVGRDARRAAGSDAPLHVAEAFTPATRARYRSEIRPALEATGMWSGDLELVAGGSPRVVEAVVVGDVDPHGTLRWAAVLAIDVADQRRRVAELSHRASHDPLTGLPNRALLAERLGVARSVAQRLGSQVALIALDLDGFKQVNDLHGHLAGDILLQQVTARLSSVVRPADTVARYGGDEFMVVLHPPESTSAAVQVAQRMRDRLRHPPYRILDATIEISASVGLTVVDADDPAEVPALIEAADRAMYRAKRSGGDRVRLAATDTAATDQLDRLDGRRAELVEALAADDFEPLFDPFVDATTGDVTALRITPSWMHPDRGRLPATEFLEDAELTGLAAEIRWRTAALAVATMAAGAAATHAERLPLVVELSLDQLRDRTIDDRLGSLADDAYGWPVWISVVEGDLVELEADGALDLARILHQHGLGMALTGHGRAGLPLAVLAELPLRLLCIDEDLTRTARERPRAVALATTLGAGDDITIAAAGVASSPARDVLALLGVDWVRGPVTGGAVPADQLAEITRPRP